MSKKNKNKADLVVQKTSVKGTSSRGGDIAFVILLLISVVALVTILNLSMQYSAGTNEQAVLMAETYSEELNNRFELQIGGFREKTTALAVAVKNFDTREELDAFLMDIPRTEGYRNVIASEIRYFSGNNEYTQRKKEALKDEEKNVYITDMRKNGVLATYGLIYDADGTKPCVACYSPVVGSPIIDGIVLSFPQESVLSFVDDLDKEKSSYAELQAVCCINDATEASNRAQILAIIQDKSGQMKINDSFFGYLNNLSNDSAMYDDVLKLIEENKSGSVKLELQNEQYVVSVGQAGPTDTGLYVISLYQSQNVYSEGYELISTIITIMAILVATMLVFAIYFFMSRRRINARIEEINMVNTDLDCPTLLKFEKNAREILDENRATKYVVVVSHVQHFSYIADKYGASTSLTILKHIKNVIYTSISAEETYGYLSDGEFVFLLMYRDDNLLNNQLVSMNERFKALPPESVPKDYHLSVSYGVYIMADKNYSEPVAKMVDKAMSVRNEASIMNVKQIFHQYTPMMENKHLRRAEIESRMEEALASGEFRVFYQPKYNLQTEDIDGAEVLVRWYDAERKHYRRPDEFLPVFEENGFISKLDRQVYYTACETLAEWSSKGRKIYPISVNVSRVTAIQEDFLNYYIAVKRRFNIPNDFITLEFTESFAYENYDHLGGIAQKLRAAGFLCSVDDFGTGSSTFTTLQKLEMDEIKLDRFFIIEDPLPEKYKIILQNVIDLGKKLNMKITQEGVETREYVRMLRSMGCEVIQGYYFSKPMGIDDYEKFIDDFIASGRVLGEE